MNKVNFKFKKYPITIEKSNYSESLNVVVNPDLKDKENSYPCVFKYPFSFGGLNIRTDYTRRDTGKILIYIIDSQEEYDLWKDIKEIEIMIFESKEMKDKYYLNV